MKSQTCFFVNFPNQHHDSKGSSMPLLQAHYVLFAVTNLWHPGTMFAGESPPSPSFIDVFIADEILFPRFSACKHGHFPMAPWPHGQSAVSPGTRPTATRFRSWSCLRGTSGRIRNVPHAMQKKPRRSTKRLPGDWGIWMDPTIVLAHVYNMYILMIMFVYN